MVDAATPLGDLLVADDDQAFLDILVKTFRRDFTVHAASDGRRALELLEQMTPSAVLVDEMMPHALGTEVLARAKERHPAAARMLMTASTDFDRAVASINQGAIHRFFAKPLRPMELRSAVLDVVERMRNEALLRVELDTLRDLRAPAPAKPHVFAFSSDAHVTEAMSAACKLRGYQFLVEGLTAVAQTVITNKAPDLLVATLDANLPDVETLVRLAQTMDEGVGVMIVDLQPTWNAAQAALALGAQDYVGMPLPPPAQLADRMERCLHHRMAIKDMRRVTRDLITANRALAQARRKQEEESVRVLNAMIRALEARDAYTAGHTDRVAAISVRLGEVLQLKADRMEHVRVGALLHDIGKIGVRDAVLLKPGRLTVEEFEAIKTHATMGFDLLADIEQFRCVVPIIRAHHERLDGSGYPDGLRGGDIPLEARIVAVADILDAITSTRPYRAGTSVDSAFEILAGLENREVDTVVMDALRHLHKQGRLVDLLQAPGAVG